MRRFLLLLLALLFPAASLTAEPFQIDAKERVLENGLKILVVENPTARTVSCRILYRVGSANEQPGLTGLAHFFEHLMFKGTRTIGVKDLEEDARLRREIDAVADAMRAIRIKRRPSKADRARLEDLQAELDALIEEQREVVKKNETMDLYRNAGGTGVNASTSRDATQYQVTLPANKLELFMWVESDRLSNAIFREFHAEKEVVREERRLAENRPTHGYREALNQVVYGSHPYAWPVLGWHEDLMNATREDARDFFERFYVPDNAVIVLTGKVEAEKAFALAREYFGEIPRGTRRRPTLPDFAPDAIAERRIVSEAETQPRVDLVYYRKPIGSEDEAVYQVLAGVLNGPSGRLEQHVVRKAELATRASASAFPSRYISTFTIGGQTKGDTSPEALLGALDAELEKLKTERISRTELQRAKNGLRARLLQMLQSDEMLSLILGYYEVMDGWERLNETLRAVEKVTASDVQRVAQELFRKKNRVVGLLHDASETGDDASPSSEETSRASDDTVEKSEDRPAHPDDLTYPTLSFEPPKPEAHRLELSNGLRIYIREDHRLPTVQVKAHVRAGSLWADQPGLASATGELMKRGGTKEMTEDELDARLDLLAARISSSFGETSGSVSLFCFDRDVDECLLYFRDVLLQPAFRPDRLETWKDEALQAIARRNDSPSRISRREFRRALYGSHPRGRILNPEDVKALTRASLQKFHARMVAPESTILSVAGNFDRKKMVEKLKKVFGDWQGEAPSLTAPPAPEKTPKREGIRFIETDASQGYVLVGHLGPRRNHPDATPLRVLNGVLRKRIFNRIRTDEGLAYSAYSYLRLPDHHPGLIGAGFQSKSESVAYALELLFEELEKIRSSRISAEELAGVKEGMIDAFPSRFSTSRAIVSLFANHELAGRDFDALTTWQDDVRACTARELLAVARRHLHPDRMIIQIVGSKEDILAGDGTHDVDLSRFGPIIDVPLDDPGIEREQTPSDVVETAFAALREGNLDRFLGCLTAEARKKMTAIPNIRKRFRGQAESPAIKNMEVEVKSETTEGKKATVEVEISIRINDQTMTRPRSLSLVKEDGSWCLERGF